jgi:3-oxoacyl-[acyl-carrier-protein] synthase-3
MKGNELFKRAVRAMGQAARLALVKANVERSEVRKVIPHQANLRIIRATQEALGLPADKMFINVDRFGNTGAASVAIALSEFLTNEPVQAGDNLLLVAFGGGLTWASTVLRWADIAAVRRQSAARVGARAA